MALEREVLAKERTAIRLEEEAAIVGARKRLEEAKALQEQLESRENVLARFRAADGPELLEVHFKATVNIVGTGIRDKKVIRIADIPETKRPKFVDMAAERKLVIIPKGHPMHVFPYEGIQHLVYEPMTP